MNKALVAFAALMFTCFGAIGLVDPSRSLALIHLSAIDTTSINEIRAMYGGVELGIAAFLFACLAGRWSLRSGLFVAAALLAGAATGRFVSLFIEGMPVTSFVGIWLFEATYAAACVFALMHTDD